jgi:hypothetical protein
MTPTAINLSEIRYIHQKLRCGRCGDLTKSSAASQNITSHGHYLNDLEEHSGSVADRLGEDLQQRALVVAVDQDAQLLGQLVLLLVHLVRAHADLGALVVVVALAMKPMEALRCKQYCNACPLFNEATHLSRQELETAPGRGRAHHLEGLEDVAGEVRDVLHTLALRVKQILITRAHKMTVRFAEHVQCDRCLTSFCSR